MKGNNKYEIIQIHYIYVNILTKITMKTLEKNSNTLQTKIFCVVHLSRSWLLGAKLEYMEIICISNEG